MWCLEKYVIIKVKMEQKNGIQFVVKTRKAFTQTVGAKFQRDEKKLLTPCKETIKKTRKPVLSRYVPTKLSKSVIKKEPLATDRMSNNYTTARKQDKQKPKQKESVMEKVNRIKTRLDYIKKNYDPPSESEEKVEPVLNSDHNFIESTAKSKPRRPQMSPPRAKTCIPQRRRHFGLTPENDKRTDEYIEFLERVRQYDDQFSQAAKENESQIMLFNGIKEDLAELNKQIVNESHELVNVHLIKFLQNSPNKHEASLKTNAFDWAVKNTIAIEQNDQNFIKSIIKPIYLYDTENFNGFEEDIDRVMKKSFEGSNKRELNHALKLIWKKYIEIYGKVHLVLPFTCRALHKVFEGFVLFMDKAMMDANLHTEELKKQVEMHKIFVKENEKLKEKLDTLKLELDLAHYQLNLEEKQVEAKLGMENLAVEKLTKGVREMTKQVNFQYDLFTQKVKEELSAAAKKVQEEAHEQNANLEKVLDSTKEAILQIFTKAKDKNMSRAHIGIQANLIKGIEKEHWDAVHYIESQIFPKGSLLKRYSRVDFVHTLDTFFSPAVAQQRCKFFNFKNFCMFDNPINEFRYHLQSFFYQNHTAPYKEYIAFINGLKHLHNSSNDTFAELILRLLDYPIGTSAHYSPTLKNILVFFLAKFYELLSDESCKPKVEKSEHSIRQASFLAIFKTCYLDRGMSSWVIGKLCNYSGEIRKLKRLIKAALTDPFRLEKLLENTQESISVIEAAAILTQVVAKIVLKEQEKIKEKYLDLDTKGKGIDKAQVIKLLAELEYEKRIPKYCMDQICGTLLEESIMRKLYRLKHAVKFQSKSFEEEFHVKYKDIDKVLGGKWAVYLTCQRVITENFKDLFAKCSPEPEPLLAKQVQQHYSICTQLPIIVLLYQNSYSNYYLCMNLIIFSFNRMLSKQIFL
eukprot:TRINITY_DN2335_c0_g1_i2.p2 TRINITY_DN2335_c0_g1~~TRINITY_DN2335_c0_g1_i2.p2  ORF type:complete len:913 (-),score=104.46 TRINITY_DN2335_c0_g1_i2:3134-5872(-)